MSPWNLRISLQKFSRFGSSIYSLLVCMIVLSVCFTDLTYESSFCMKSSKISLGWLPPLMDKNSPAELWPWYIDLKLRSAVFCWLKYECWLPTKDLNLWSLWYYLTNSAYEVDVLLISLELNRSSIIFENCSRYFRSSRCRSRYFCSSFFWSRFFMKFENALYSKKYRN